MTEQSNDAMIEAVGLSKFYGRFAAVQDVSFEIPKGQVAAFLGPNGAGKSTVMKILTGYLSPSEGYARIGGYDVLEDRLNAAQLVGYLPENGPLYLEMTPRAFLNYIGSARGISKSELKTRLDYVIDHCNLAGVLNKAIGKLSKGYRQRVGMAHAILHDPQVLILDEPTAGLDPNQISQVRELITTLGQKKTILLSTHIMQEVKAVASRVIFVHNGKKVLDGPVSDMEAVESGSMEETFHKLTA